MLGEKLCLVNNLWEDDLSRIIYEEKIKWYFLGGEDTSVDFLYDYYENSRILDLETYPRNTSFAICGAGNMGKKSLKAIKHAGYNVRCFLDNDRCKQGKDIDGIRVCSFAEFVSSKELNKDTVVIIDNMRLADLFGSELFDLGFPQRNIYRTRDTIIRSAFGNIYFDLPQMKHDENEVFLDAGSFDGNTVREFIKWCDKKYSKIFAFEPMSEGYALSKKNLEHTENVEVLKLALSDHRGDAEFSQIFAGLMGSRLGSGGDYVETVQVDTIDNVMNGHPVTFIKLDIEGAELDALKGAEQTLKTYKPKLAVSLYHKNEDIYEIPLWLKEIVPEYKFYLRHYSNKRWDLVLYCIAE